MNRRILNPLLLLGAVALTVVPLLLAQAPRGEELFEGTDARAEKMIDGIRPDYRRWARPFWQPPGGEMESLLFALQAAAGAAAVGYCLGFCRGRRAGRRGGEA